MKELSIEEKAKAYDKALERAKNLHRDAIDMGENIRAKQCEIIFHELKESEDECVEKIKKDIISYLNNRQITSIAESSASEKWLTWLEKQGEKPTDEVKEVDLERDAVSFCFDNGLNTTPHIAKTIAKHFFELGLKANQEYNVIGTIEREVKIDAGGYPCIDCYIEFYDYDKDIPLAQEGDKVKIIVVKGE